MPKSRNLTFTFIESLKPREKYYHVWDTKQAGLGVKVEASGYKTYVYQYRITVPGEEEKKPKRKKIDACNRITLDDARKVAGEYASKVTQGIDPATVIKEKLVIEVCEEYLEYRKEPTGRHKKISDKTYKNWKQIKDKYIAGSEFGNSPIRTVTVPDANAFMDSLAHIPAQANRVRTYLQQVFDDYSIGKGYRDNVEIWNKVKKYEENPQRLRIADDELEKFTNYLIKAEQKKIFDKRGAPINRYWIYFVWLLYFTGARPNEILTCKREYIDLDNRAILLPTSKTGSKEIHLSSPAIEIIKLIDPIPDNHYLIPGANGNHLINYMKQWNNMREAIGIEAPPYGLRRYFATQGRKISDIELLARIMGHATEAMTEMYAGEDEEIKKKEKKVISLANERIGQALKEKIKTT